MSQNVTVTEVVTIKKTSMSILIQELRMVKHEIGHKMDYTT